MPRPTGLELTEEQLTMLRQRVGEGNIADTAEAIGVDRRHLYGVLAGRYRPSETMLMELCQAIGIEVEVATKVKFTIPRK